MTRVPASSLSDVTQNSNDPGDRTLICFSHLRWDFVLQRPQHLMTFLARYNRVTFWEEPIEIEAEEAPRLELRDDTARGVRIATPHLPGGLSPDDANAALAELLNTLAGEATGKLLLWYYTPMMLPFSRHLEADCVIYDCMDELANFRFAPPELLPLESELLTRADLVFTGGYSLYEAKRDRHANIDPVPSSVDRAHFAQARTGSTEPADQAGLPGPRLGFYGVIDERMDLALLAAVADARPDWSLVMVGPVVKIGKDELPRRPNIHYLGNKDYSELPAYLSGWDVALMPFAINESTRFISPTKTPEYLAAGLRVVSTPIRDVVYPYGEEGLVAIAAAEGFVEAIDRELQKRGGAARAAWLDAVDRQLSTSSWDATWKEMDILIDEAVASHAHRRVAASRAGATAAVARG